MGITGLSCKRGDSLRVQDLGILSGDILLFGGIYSNVAALQALEEQAALFGIAPSNMLCSGDIVAYCADAEACVARIRALGCPIIAGNCEIQLASDADDCGCGYEEGTECSLLSRNWYAHARADVSAENKVWMSKLPDWIVFEHGNKRYVIVHGGASDISRFVWPTTPVAEIAAEISTIEAQIGAIDCVIAGHTGIAVDVVVGKVRWVNSGAVGMPPHDGDQRGCFAVLRDNEFEFKRLRYDVEVAVAAMKMAGLTQGYEQSLHSGFWPSEDNLPIDMRRFSDRA
jgi:predicted phosphodiesterase